jgi:TonB family protein
MASKLSGGEYVTSKAAILFLLLFACGASVFAQEKTGKIIFYRESDFLDSDYKPLLFCDGVELARIRSRSYLEVAAQPGRHSCVAESAQGPETIVEIVPGGAAYQRVVITPTVKRHAVLTASDEEEYKKHKKLARITTAELDSVQPLLPVAPVPPIALAGTNGYEPSANGAALLDQDPDVVHPGVGGVTYPTCSYCPFPEYTEQARRAKLNGTVELKVIVGVDGKAHNIEIVKALGNSLDEKAVNAVQSWRFKPAAGPNGDPVPVVVPIEVTFRLLK